MKETYAINENIRLKTLRIYFVAVDCEKINS